MRAFSEYHGQILHSALRDTRRSLGHCVIFSLRSSSCSTCPALSQKNPVLANRSIVPARTSPAYALPGCDSSPPHESISAHHPLSASGSAQTPPSFLLRCPGRYRLLRQSRSKLFCQLSAPARTAPARARVRWCPHAPCESFRPPRCFPC